MKCLLTAAVSLWAAGAWAKGEGGGGDVPCENPLSPRPYAVRLPQNADTPLVIASNIGVLISRDQGATFELVCPEALGRFTVDSGLQANYSTPTVVVLPDGTLMATNYPLGLRRSTDGCDWPVVEDPVVQMRAASSLTILAPGTLFVSFASGESPLGVASSADGLLFALTSAQSGAAGVQYDGVLAASDGQTLYAIMTQFGTSTTQTLLVSADAGGIWNPAHSFDSVQVSLGAVDASDPARLLMRQRTSAVCVVDDTLLLDEGGGASPTAVKTVEQDPITGGIIRPNGDLWIATLSGGVSKSANDGVNWAPAGGPDHVRCLAGDADQVVACLASPDPTLGLVARTADEGASWQALLTYDRIVGPPACLADTCAMHWRKIQDSWISPVTPADGGTDGRRFDLGGDARQGPGSMGSGCACDAGTDPRAGVSWVGLLLVLLRQRSARAMRRRKSSASASLS
jgi:hypothetical protein